MELLGIVTTLFLSTMSNLKLEKQVDVFFNNETQEQSNKKTAYRCTESQSWGLAKILSPTLIGCDIIN